MKYLTKTRFRQGLECPIKLTGNYKESNEVPQVADFSVLDGYIEGLDSEWEFIDSLYYKGSKLEITGYLDSDCKSSEVIIYSN